MAVRGRTCRGLGFGLIIALAVPLASASSPVGVSPGAADRVAEVEGRCPTFIWGAVPGAAAYELVVYRLPDEPLWRDGGALELSVSDEVLFAALPAGATAWQPELADGLAPGERYVWFVRAVANPETWEGSDWSGPRFFEVAAAPSAEQVRQALDVLSRYVATGADEADLAALAEDDAAEPARENAARSGASRPTPAGPLKSRQGLVTAIQGEVTDPSGLAFGVLGASASPDGAGVAAVNTGGGPDLVLDGWSDGVSDTYLYQDRIEVASADPRTFTFANTGGGGMTLDVDGVQVVTTATDQDTLAALGCASGELAKWNGWAWHCARDLDSDTLAGLGCAQWQVAKWTGTAWACFPDDDALGALPCTADQIAKHDGSVWTCAEDEEGTLTAGPGIIIENGQVEIDWHSLQTSHSTLDSTGDVGEFSSTAIGNDGLGLISYYDTTNGDLKVAHCNDVACSSATTTTLDSVGDVGRYVSMVIGVDGLGLISYYDHTNGDLKVAHCNDVACSSATTAIIDSVGSQYTSIAIGTDGLAMVSYYDIPNANLKVAHCSDTACSSATTTTIDSTGNVGYYSSIAIGDDGLALISYYDDTNDNLKVAHCNDAACSSASRSIIDSTGNVGWFTSIAIGDDGLGLISYFDFTNGNLKVAHCYNTACSTATTITIDSLGTVGPYTSIAVADDGLALVSYVDDSNRGLKIARCNNTRCSSATTATVDSAIHNMRTSIAIGADGLGLISYYDITNGDLKVAHLGIGVP